MGCNCDCDTTDQEKTVVSQKYLNEIVNVDGIHGMSMLEDKSIDMVLCDLPYGTTQNKWDVIIPFDQLWKEYTRIIKDNGAIVLTAAQPFTSLLISSNLSMFRYSLVWDKKNTTGFLNANRMPLRRHEDIVVFYKKLPVYNPQKTDRGSPRKKGGAGRTNRGCYGEYKDTDTFNNSYYPTSIIEISNADKTKIQHPTQKPVGLFEYLIKTYSNPGDIVLDNCIGSGTTAIAAINTGRSFIGFEIEAAYCQIANERISCTNASVPDLANSVHDTRSIGLSNAI